MYKVMPYTVHRFYSLLYPEHGSSWRRRRRRNDFIWDKQISAACMQRRDPSASPHMPKNPDFPFLIRHLALGQNWIWLKKKKKKQQQWFVSKWWSARTLQFSCGSPPYAEYVCAGCESGLCVRANILAAQWCRRLHIDTPIFVYMYRMDMEISCVIYKNGYQPAGLCWTMRRCESVWLI